MTRFTLEHRWGVALAPTYAFAYTYPMKTTSFSEFRRRLAETIDRVSADREPVLITRDSNKPSAVLISLEDYASLEETRYLLASPANADRLIAAVRDLDAGGGSEEALSE